jgi:hypothetical protein
MTKRKSKEKEIEGPPSKKPKDDQWKTDINNTLAALTSMVQQLASAKPALVEQEMLNKTLDPPPITSKITRATSAYSRCEGIC